MTNPKYPELIGETGHRGDTTDGRPPPGITAAPGQLQGSALTLAPARLAQSPDLMGDVGRRGDLSGSHPTTQPRDPYGTRRGRDLKADWDWLAFAATLPADPVPLTGSLSGQIVAGGRNILMGGSLYVVTTSAATWSVYDGMDTGGTLINRTIVAANSFAPLAMPAAGVLCETGVFVTSTGTLVLGSLWVVHLWKYPFTPPGE